MSYRDELGAAHAKIEVLETQLRELREERARPEEVDATTAALDESVAALERIERQIEQEQSPSPQAFYGEMLRRAEQAHNSPSRASTLPTLYVANAVRAPLEAGKGLAPVEVQCPECARVGEAVEMVALGPPTHVYGLVTARPVLCPRCLFVGRQRVE